MTRRSPTALWRRNGSWHGIAVVDYWNAAWNAAKGAGGGGGGGQSAECSSGGSDAGRSRSSSRNAKSAHLRCERTGAVLVAGRSLAVAGGGWCLEGERCVRPRFQWCLATPRDRSRASGGALPPDHLFACRHIRPPAARVTPAGATRLSFMVPPPGVARGVRASRLPQPGRTPAPARSAHSGSPSCRGSRGSPWRRRRWICFWQTILTCQLSRLDHRRAPTRSIRARAPSDTTR